MRRKKISTVKYDRLTSRIFRALFETAKGAAKSRGRQGIVHSPFLVSILARKTALLPCGNPAFCSWVQASQKVGRGFAGNPCRRFGRRSVISLAVRSVSAAVNPFSVGSITGAVGGIRAGFGAVFGVGFCVVFSAKGRYLICVFSSKMV